MFRTLCNGHKLCRWSILGGQLAYRLLYYRVLLVVRARKAGISLLGDPRLLLS